MKISFPLVNGRIQRNQDTGNLGDAKSQQSKEQVLDQALGQLDTFNTVATKFAELDGKNFTADEPRPERAESETAPTKPKKSWGPLKLLPWVKKGHQKAVQQYGEELKAFKERESKKTAEHETALAAWRSGGGDEAQDSGTVVSVANRRGFKGEMRFDPENFGFDYRSELGLLQGMESLSVVADGTEFRYQGDQNKENYWILGPEYRGNRNTMAIELNHQAQTLTIDTAPNLQEFVPSMPEERTGEKHTFKMENGQVLKPEKGEIKSLEDLYAYKAKARAFRTLEDELATVRVEISQLDDLEEINLSYPEPDAATVGESIRSIGHSRQGSREKYQISRTYVNEWVTEERGSTFYEKIPATRYNPGYTRPHTMKIPTTHRETLWTDREIQIDHSKQEASLVTLKRQTLAQDILGVRPGRHEEPAPKEMDW